MRVFKVRTKKFLGLLTYSYRLYLTLSPPYRGPFGTIRARGWSFWRKDATVFASLSEANAARKHNDEQIDPD